MELLGEKFNNIIIKNKDDIEHYICDIICDELLCPSDEGVSCIACMKHALEIIIKV